MDYEHDWAVLLAEQRTAGDVAERDIEHRPAEQVFGLSGEQLAAHLRHKDAHLSDQWTSAHDERDGARLERALTERQREAVRAIRKLELNYEQAQAAKGELNDPGLYEQIIELNEAALWLAHETYRLVNERQQKRNREFIMGEMADALVWYAEHWMLVDFSLSEASFNMTRYARGVFTSAQCKDILLTVDGGV